jgi:deazaflavin-dependent oxidoreductase (nitroreductase family)
MGTLRIWNLSIHRKDNSKTREDPTLTERLVHQPVEAPARRAPKLPPRWFIRAAWIGHRAILRFTRGRRGLASPKPGGRFGYLRLTSVGRRSGQERVAILGYVEDGAHLVTLAMNGWADPDPAWWLNLQARPEAMVELKGAARHPVRARAAEGEERQRLVAILRDHSGWGDIAGHSGVRSGETAVVVFEPVGAEARHA